MLALYYYSTNGDGWDETWDFLSPKEECRWSSIKVIGEDDTDHPNDLMFHEEVEWKGVVCNADGALTGMRMCKYSSKKRRGRNI